MVDQTAANSFFDAAVFWAQGDDDDYAVDAGRCPLIVFRTLQYCRVDHRRWLSRVGLIGKHETAQTLHATIATHKDDLAADNDDVDDGIGGGRNNA